MPEWSEILSKNAAAYARVAIDNIGREFPSGIHHTMTAPGDFPYRPAERTPAAIFTPVTVSDSTDGQIAHLHGLNASRAWCWRRIAESLPAGDPRIESASAAARVHADAALPHVVGDHYAVEHWLAAYAVLLLAGAARRPG